MTYCNPWGRFALPYPNGLNILQKENNHKYSSKFKYADMSYMHLCSKYLFFLILVCEAIGTATTPGLLCQRRVIVKMIVEKHGMYIGRGNRSSRRKRAPAQLSSITKSHMTRPGFRTRAAAVGSRRITA
jgi:hypothetical protein